MQRDLDLNFKTYILDVFNRLRTNGFERKYCVGGQRCLVLSTNSTTWFDANKKCEHAGGNLLRVKNSAIEDTARKWMTDTGGAGEVWIGAKLNLEGDLGTMTGDLQPNPQRRPTRDTSRKKKDTKSGRGGTGGGGGGAAAGTGGDSPEEDTGSGISVESEEDDAPWQCQTIKVNGNELTLDDMRSCFGAHSYMCTTAPDRATENCFDNYIKYEDNLCIKLSTAPTNWFLAREACVKEGSSLWDYKDYSMEQIGDVIRLLKVSESEQIKNIWTSESEVHWKWPDQSEVKYTNWFPSDSPSQDLEANQCVALSLRANNLGWISDDCENVNDFICDFSLDDLKLMSTGSSTLPPTSPTPSTTTSNKFRPKKDADSITGVQLAIYISVPLAILTVIAISIACVCALRNLRQKAIDKAIDKRLSVYGDISTVQRSNSYMMNLPGQGSILQVNSVISSHRYQGIEQPGDANQYDVLDPYDSLDHNVISGPGVEPPGPHPPRRSDSVTSDYSTTQDDDTYLELIGSDNTSSTSKSALMPETPNVSLSKETGMKLSKDEVNASLKRKLPDIPSVGSIVDDDKITEK
ncbi:hypothetical protein CAPTEDRAFT_227661 [Capitella teleta]|uniref:C-type lectin domain-containing protein n=1 Tax=Capitella teleta TaxID=283909 RepID=R7VLK2_CAPTE|nr:hypothetical protein CAPTEDRAFT_227661 [Capitella teleta]|eukprot:ELU18366.1 hypothetical protein CAPTEDRAFT_227661 [Capitella teleta]